MHLLFQSNTSKVFIPKYSIDEGSLSISSAIKGKKFVDFTAAENREIYEMLQKIASLWKAKDIHNFFVVGVEGKKTFRWEIIPYYESEMKIFKQLKVAWRLFFGGKIYSSKFKDKWISEYVKHRSIFSAALHESRSLPLPASDPFCQSAVIDRQKIQDSSSVNVLYNYRPVAPKHFLVVPKLHFKNLLEIHSQVYIDAMASAKQLIQNFGEPTSKIYLYHSNGSKAGQTVPHWHLHVTMPSNSRNEFWGKCKVFFNIVWGGSPLKSEELRTRVVNYRHHLARA